MYAEISSVKKVGQDLILSLKAISENSDEGVISFPNRIYICKFTHRPKLAQRVRSTGDRLIIESASRALDKQYVRLTGHHLSYQEDFMTQPVHSK